MSEQELKPCPFCGSKNIKQPAPYESLKRYICLGCGCHAGIDTWNTRSPSPPLAVGENQNELLKEIDQVMGNLLLCENLDPCRLCSDGKEELEEIQNRVRLSISSPSSVVGEAEITLSENGCKCQRCGKQYYVDFMVDDNIWEEIAVWYGHTHAMLCGDCILESLKRRVDFGAYRITDIDNPALRWHNTDEATQFDGEYLCRLQKRNPCGASQIYHRVVVNEKNKWCLKEEEQEHLIAWLFIPPPYR